MSEISIYNTKITPERNSLIEDIEDYLDTCTLAYGASDFQYLKISLDTSIKLNLDQQYVGKKIGNYLKLEQDNKNYYFFILKANWKAQKTVELQLSLDTINTFANDFEFNKKTCIKRQHKNRFIVVGNKAYRKIDVRSEGATPVLYHDTDEDVTIVDNRLDIDWYLLYKSHDSSADSIVDCYLVPGLPISLNVPTTNTVIVPNQLEEGKYYYALDSELFKDSSGNEHKSERLNSSTFRWVALHRLTSTTMEVIYYDTGNNYLHISGTYTGITSVTFDSTASLMGMYKLTSTPSSRAGVYPYLPPNTLVSFQNTGFTTATLKCLTDVDRSDARNIKLIKLPYAPNTFTISNNNLTFNTKSWGFDSTTKFLKLNDLNLSFENEFTMNENILKCLEVDLSQKGSIISRNDYYESKLYHSDFYVPKLAYDSFNLGINLERVKLDSSTDLSSLNLIFKPTSTINSKFLFKLPQYKLKFAGEDYPNIFTVSRNNDITLYNDAYINYIKTGYNYDIKNKERSNATNWVTTGISMVGGIAGLAAGAFTGGISAAAGVSLITSAVSGIANNINNNIANETAIEQKLAQYRNQSSAVSGSDDVDLMSYYTNNRCKVSYYKVSDVIKNDFADLFYYCGYADNSQEIPNIESRKWFNYLQCDAVFEEEDYTPYSEYLADIKSRFSTGVTIYHNVNNSWDLDQIKENWEVSL